LLEKIAIKEELPQFEEAEKLLFVPEPDPESGVIEQFDGYYKLQETTIDELRSRMIHPNEYLGAGQGLAVATKVIKQADVVLMLNVFKDRYSDHVKRANWEYYEPRTEHGSSLSACAYAMVAAEIGKLDFAYKYFLQTAKIDLEAKYKVFVGTIFMGGSHPAANGGAWMTTVFGFGGVRTNEKGLVIRPRLYKKWNSLHFNLAYRGDRFGVKITADSVEVVAADSNKQTHIFEIADESAICAPGQTLRVRYADEQVGSPRRDGKATQPTSTKAMVAAAR
jgi:kojibiose phosphorylase